MFNIPKLVHTYINKIGVYIAKEQGCDIKEIRILITYEEDKNKIFAYKGNVFLKQLEESEIIKICKL